MGFGAFVSRISPNTVFQLYNGEKSTIRLLLNLISTVITLLWKMNIIFMIAFAFAVSGIS